MLHAKMLRITIFTMLILSLVSSALYAAENEDLVRIVKNIGKTIGYETDTKKQAEEFYVLSKNRLAAIRQLLNELKPVNESIILTDASAKNTEGLHVVWSIRALRFLSGCMFFTEKAEEDRFTTDDQIRTMLLMQKKDNEYSFFAGSAGRDKIYIAPMYVQKAIIRKWQNWFNKKDDKFDTINCRDINIWYF